MQRAISLIVAVVTVVFACIAASGSAHALTRNFSAGPQDVNAAFNISNVRHSGPDSLLFDWSLEITDRIRHPGIKNFKVVEITPPYTRWISSAGRNAQLSYKECRSEPMDLEYHKVTPVRPRNVTFTICPPEDDLPRFTVVISMELLGAMRTFQYDVPLRGAPGYKALYNDTKHIDTAYALYGIQEATEGELEDKLRAVIEGFPHEDLPLTGIILGTGFEVFGFVSERPAPERTLVAIRGTQAQAEWIGNSAAAPALWERVSRPGVKIHAGFQIMYDTLYVVVDGQATPLCGYIGKRPTTIVGHSLGSALSTLAAVHCAIKNGAAQNDVKLVTLASPRVGNAAFVQLANALTHHTRIYNAPDIVAWAPSDPPFRHAGKPIAYSSRVYETLRTDLPSKEQFGCWHSLHVYLWFLDASHSVPAKCEH